MVIKEVFPNPTVKQVVFQITYPNLFYIENKIAELQLKIMEKFPDSELRYRKLFSFGEIGPDTDVKQVEKRILEGESTKKIWTFKSKQNYELNITGNSLDITSKYHKTYNLPSVEKFRDIISFVLNSFFEYVSVPILQRIGLRYIDECPIISMDNKTFKTYYSSVLPTNRFPIDKTKEAVCRVRCERGKYYLSYVENLREQDGRYVLILDFDGYAMNIEPRDCMRVTDELHEVISKEYARTIKEPVKEYMRKEALGSKDAVEK